tara:strand:+ start:115 stop:372 length:258 start_codon:yes stop_codon:yes gene_type:complete
MRAIGNSEKRYLGFICNFSSLGLSAIFLLHLFFCFFGYVLSGTLIVGHPSLDCSASSQPNYQTDKKNQKEEPHDEGDTQPRTVEC